MCIYYYYWRERTGKKDKEEEMFREAVWEV